MKACSALNVFVERMAADDRLVSLHLALFASMCYMGRETDTGEWFEISRKELLRFSGIRSQVTYHARMKELVKLGYIRYQPSYDPNFPSKAALLTARIN